MWWVRVFVATLAVCLAASNGNAEPSLITAATDAAAPEAAEQSAHGSEPCMLGHAATDPALSAALVAPETDLAEAPLAPPEPTLFLDADLTNQRLTVSDETGELYSWPISSGIRRYATPTGTYKPHWASRMHYSRQYDWSPMPHSIFFHRGYAFHGTYATGRLGRPASHGCIRLSPKNAKALYGLVHKHGLPLTKVVVRGSPKFAPEPVARRTPPHSRSQYSRARDPGFSPFFGYFSSY